MSMVEETKAADPGAPAGTQPVRRRASRVPKGIRRFSRTIFRSPLSIALAGGAIHCALWFVRRSQRVAPGSSEWRAVLTREHPAIVALWHGQHLLAPFFRPKNLPYVALLSRSADAAFNAAVVERFGIATVRGSGGRERQAASQKGGARALIALRRCLRDGFGVCMIADVPKGAPRQAGLGIVTLARISGRPIIPSAAATSRRYVIESSWDKTTLPLPFGRLAVVLGDPITVPADADAATMEAKRRELTLAIEAAHQRALALASQA